MPPKFRTGTRVAVTESLMICGTFKRSLLSHRIMAGERGTVTSPDDESVAQPARIRMDKGPTRKPFIVGIGSHFLRKLNALEELAEVAEGSDE